MKQKSQKVIEQKVEELLQRNVLLKKDAQQKGLKFSCLGREELTRKIRTSTNPFVHAQWWVAGTQAGNVAFYTVGITNPGSVQINLYVSIFFGVSNFLDDIGIGLCGRDTRWPFLSSDDFKLNAGEDIKIRFDYTTPNLPPPPKTTHFGNSVLWQGNWHDKGVYFDRGLFDITLT